MWQSQRANVSAPGTSPAAGPPSVPYGAEATIAFSPEAQLPPAGEVWKVPSAYFATLEAAISRAPAGTKIEVGEHKWTERIEITKDIHLVGKSQEHSIISVDGRKGAALGITSGTKVIVENMTLEHSSTEVVTGGAPLVHTETTQATFRKCRFIKAAGHGLEVATGSVIHAEDCSFEQNTHAGASVQTGAKLTLKNCNLSGNNVAVSVGGDQAKLFLEGGLLQGNATYGVEVISGAYAELTRAKIRESSQHGIFVQNPGSSILATEVSVEKCKRGTQIESGGSGTLKDCKHDGNEIGISLVDSGTATLSGGSASQNSTHGIAIEATGKIGSILISGMKVKSNASVGLLLSGAEVKADVAGNYFGPNGLIDILGKGQASGHFSKNTLHTGPDFKDFEGPVQWDADNVEGPTSGT